MSGRSGPVANVSNLEANVTVTGTERVGGLIGRLFVSGGGRINVTGGQVSGIARGTADVTADQVGGAFGLVFQNPSSPDGIPIADVHSAVDLARSPSPAGGLIGMAQVQGGVLRIERSSASGSAVGNQIAGGFIGRLESVVGATTELLNVASTGAVTASTDAGGFIGLINPSNTAITITNAYSAGSVNPFGTPGGFVGQIVGTAPAITASFWDSSVNADLPDVGTGPDDLSGLTPRTSTQLQTFGTFNAAGWAIIEGWPVGINATALSGPIPFDDGVSATNGAPVWGICAEANGASRTCCPGTRATRAPNPIHLTLTLTGTQIRRTRPGPIRRGRGRQDQHPIPG